MAKIKHINCPKCGGTLGLHGLERVVKCRYCGVWSLVELAGVAPEYYVNPKLKEADARRVVQSLLREKDMPPGLIRNSRFHSARLYFIPYHELSGRRLGTMISTEMKPTGPARMVREVSYGPRGESMVHMKKVEGPKEKKVDTRVVMSDLGRLEPAIVLDEWGIEEAEIGAIRSDPAGMLQPMNRRKVERYGKVYNPTISSEQMLTMLNTKAETAWLDDQTEIAEVRVKRIYYPVWRIRYRFQGRLYGASVDGVTGKVMAARAPQDDGSRVLWLLGTTAFVSLVIGRILRGVFGSLVFDSGNVDMIIQVMSRGFHVIIPVVLIGLLLAALVMGFGWEQFRYPGEIVIRGEDRSVEKINRPDHTFFDSVQNILGSILGAYGDTLRKGRRR